MKKLITSILLILFSSPLFAQITTTKIIEKENTIDNSTYDSTKNFLGYDVYKYIGQTFYVKEKTEGLKKYGYDNFVLDYTKSTLGNKGNVYKCCDSYFSKYEELAGKYFEVLDVIKTDIFHDFYIKLQEKESKDIVYFKYNNLRESSFPFIVVGYFEKIKNLVLNQEYVFKDILHVYKDINTGNNITNKLGFVWKCLDVTTSLPYSHSDEFEITLLLQNELGEKILVPYEHVFINTSGGPKVYTKADYNIFIKEFGPKRFNLILKSKVEIGMNQLMCVLSWGLPNKINSTITQSGKTEQWVYENNYLYFNGDKLVAIQ